MNWNRFDICEAYLVYATLWHSGQFSEDYKIFGRLERMKYKPGLGFKGTEGELNPNAREIYFNLVEQRQGKVPQFTYKEWEDENLEGEWLLLKKEFFKEGLKPEDNLFFATGGFGTTKDTLGTAIFGAFSDGEEGRIERYNVDKIAQLEFIDKPER